MSLISSLLTLSVLGSPVAFARFTPPPPKMDAERIERMETAMVDRFLRRYEADVRTGADVERVFLQRYKPAYRAELRRFFRNVGPMPTVTREDHDLILNPGPDEVRLHWPRFRESRVILVGVEFTFDPSAPPGRQMRAFEAKLRAAATRERRGTASRLALWPEAHAGMTREMFNLAPKGAGAVGKCLANKVCAAGAVLAASMTFGKQVEMVWNAAVDSMCYGFYTHTDIKPGTVIERCLTWKRNDDLVKKADRSDSICNTAQIEKELKWVKGKNSMNCPPADETKGTQEFSVWLGQVQKDANNEWQSQAWYFVKGSAGADGNLTEAHVFKNEDEAKVANPKANAIASFTFSKNQDNPVELTLMQTGSTPGAGAVPVSLSCEGSKVKQMSDKVLAATAVRFMHLGETAQALVKVCNGNNFDAKFTREKEAERKQHEQNQPHPQDAMTGK